jgi:hypothetical protein
MSAISNTQAANMLGATLPTGTSGKPGAWTPLSSAGAMFLRLNSAAYSGSDPGATEAAQLANANGYVTNGLALGASSAASVVSNVETVVLPAANLSWTCALSGGWTIDSLDITDYVQAWAWFGNFNGQPISIANGNTFQVSASAVTVTLQLWWYPMPEGRGFG